MPLGISVEIILAENLFRLHFEQRNFRIETKKIKVARQTDAEKQKRARKTARRREGVHEEKQLVQSRAGGVRKVKIKLPGGDVIWNHGYREKGGATSVGGSRRITLSCAIDFKNKMAIGQHFCLNICHFSCQFSLFFLSPHIRDVMLPSAELTQCS